MTNPIVVCLIDDDTIYQFYMKKIIYALHKINKVLSFGDGEEAAEFMESNISNNSELPNIIFLDINMPIMDGWEFLDEYAKLKPKIDKKITLYMLSSSNDEKDIERAKKINDVSDFLVKPIRPDQLEEIIKVLKLEGNESN